MLAILWALAAAVGYGSSDFAAGMAARRASVIRVALMTEAVCVIIVGLVLPLTGAAHPDLRAVAWGMVSGLAGVSGALVLYLGFRHAAFSVAGPLSAVAAAGFSVLAGLLLGERPTALALTGIALALPAIVGVSASARGTAGAPAPGGAGGTEVSGTTGLASPARSTAAGGALGRAPTGASYGLAAGVCFALLFIGLNQAGSGSGLWPVFSGQVTAFAAVGCLAAFTGDFRLPEARGGWLAAIAGITGGPGTIFYFLATHHGLLAVAAVLSSLYPAVTILLARLLAGERLTAVRLAGLSLGAASVALIAAGGAGG
ncbi:MAG TPA: EamA family transporter [Streptosporangiaceae bacterium]|jgi:drug/metabolite transporter (DMT)-like permease|nr:EamA family transporter [Streptosporangiaceae bacterium]